MDGIKIYKHILLGKEGDEDSQNVGSREMGRMEKNDCIHKQAYV